MTDTERLDWLQKHFDTPIFMLLWSRGYRVSANPTMRELIDMCAAQPEPVQ